MLEKLKCRNCKFAFLHNYHFLLWHIPVQGSFFFVSSQSLKMANYLLVLHITPSIAEISNFSIAAKLCKRGTINVLLRSLHIFLLPNKEGRMKSVILDKLFLLLHLCKRLHHRSMWIPINRVCSLKSLAKE